MSINLDARCTKCNRTLRRLTLLAMAVDAGAQVWPDPLSCEHEFEEPQSQFLQEAAEASHHSEIEDAL